jgi:voltage-gated potassium channel Kch
MLIPMLLGSVMMVVNLGILVLAVAILIRLLTNRIGDESEQPTLFEDVKVLSLVMAVLMFGHMLQFATWALLFTWLGEFTDFATAFYHSTVNFTSLGYGDIVMSEKWRLLGALEAGNGVLMFGLSASTILSIMNALFARRKAFAGLKKSMGKSG